MLLSADHARHVARAVIDECDITVPPVNVVDIVSRKGFKLSRARLSGTAAQLIAPQRNRPLIVVSDHLREAAQERFAIAHELGHYMLGHPSPSLDEMCAPVDGSENIAHEQAADAFAFELLLPEALIAAHRPAARVDLDAVFDIAHCFLAPIDISAIRLAERTSLPYAAVLSEAGVIASATASPAFMHATKASIPRGRVIDPRTVAWRCFADGTPRPPRRMVPASAWSPSSIEEEFLEESVVLPQRGAVLTILSVLARSPTQLVLNRLATRGESSRQELYVVPQDADRPQIRSSDTTRTMRKRRQ